MFWETYSSSHETLLVYNTGRPAQLVNEWISQKILPVVEFTINNDGSNIYYNNKLWEPWKNHLRAQGCTLKLFDYVEDIVKHFVIDGCTIQSRRCDFELRMFVTSDEGNQCLVDGYLKINSAIHCLHLPGVFLYEYNVREIADIVEQEWWSANSYGLETRVIPKASYASKGPAAHFLYEHVCQQQNQEPYAMWTGDGENDCGMLEDTNFDGIVVNNAAEQLKDACAKHQGSRYVHMSSQAQSAGVLEGLKFMLARKNWSILTAMLLKKLSFGH